MIRIFRTAVCMLATLVSGCSSFYENVQDPGQLVPVASVLKSIRCEVITFLVANRIRRQEFLNWHLVDFQTAFDKYAYLDLDDKEYATVQVDLKTIDTLGLSLGIDQKFPYGPGGAFSHTSHLGPADTSTWTYSRSNLFAVTQNATLGPTPQSGLKVPQLYGDADRQDASFFCYTATKDQAPQYSAEAVESLVLHQRPDLENFHRIWVVGGETMTLARWLEIMAAEMAKNYLAQGPYTESLIPGQINYTYTLEVKPSFDLKYTLISHAYNPLIPDVNFSKDDTSTFSLYLNTAYAKAAYGAKNGNASLPSEPPIWRISHRIPNESKTKGGSSGTASAPGGTAPGTAPPRIRPRIAPSGGPGQRPGIQFSAPVALPGPPPAQQ